MCSLQYWTRWLVCKSLWRTKISLWSYVVTATHFTSTSAILCIILCKKHFFFFLHIHILHWVINWVIQRVCLFQPLYLFIYAFSLQQGNTFTVYLNVYNVHLSLYTMHTYLLYIMHIAYSPFYIVSFSPIETFLVFFKSCTYCMFVQRLL